MHQNIGKVKQVEIGNQLKSIITFHFCFVIFPWLHDLEKVISLSTWLGVRRTPRA